MNFAQLGDGEHSRLLEDEDHDRALSHLNVTAKKTTRPHENISAPISNGGTLHVGFTVHILYVQYIFHQPQFI